MGSDLVETTDVVISADFSRSPENSCWNASDSVSLSGGGIYELALGDFINFSLENTGTFSSEFLGITMAPSQDNRLPNEDLVVASGTGFFEEKYFRNCSAVKGPGSGKVYKANASNGQLELRATSRKAGGGDDFKFYIWGLLEGKFVWWHDPELEVGKRHVGSTERVRGLHLRVAARRGRPPSAAAEGSAS